MRKLLCSALIAVACFVLPTRASAQDYTRTKDVIYGRKFGTALTMDVFTPKKDANGAAVIFVLSGGWFSDRAFLEAPFVGFPRWAESYTKRGYTLFAVTHGSQPKFTIPEILQDMHRAVR